MNTGLHFVPIRRAATRLLDVTSRVTGKASPYRYQTDVTVYAGELYNVLL